MFLELIIFFILAGIFSFILFIVSYIISFKTINNIDKSDLYECGFKAFETARQPVDVKFFLIGFMFVIFDLESAYLIPWVLNFKIWGFNSFWVVIIFIFILVTGYIYELYSGILDWA